MKKRDYGDYIEDIWTSIVDIEDFVRGTSFDTFKEDKKTIYAVTRAIEIIGEAVRHIPVEIRSVYPAVPWQDMADMRNKGAHEYFGVDTQVIWATVTEDVPQLKKLIRGLIDKLPR